LNAFDNKKGIQPVKTVIYLLRFSFRISEGRKPKENLNSLNSVNDVAAIHTV